MVRGVFIALKTKESKSELRNHGFYEEMINEGNRSA